MDDVRRAEPDLCVELPVFPPRGRVRGVSFVEFASRGTERAQLEALLATLGFTHTGRHVTKDIALWQQGEIRIVLNAETEGHAATAWTARGTCICDLGLTVDDARATVDRATALGSTPFRQPLGPGQRTFLPSAGFAGLCCIFSTTNPGWILCGTWSSRRWSLRRRAQA